MRAIKRGLDSRVDLVGVIVVPASKVVVRRLGILRIHLLSLRVSLTNQFMQVFRLLAEVSLVLVVTLVRA